MTTLNVQPNERGTAIQTIHLTGLPVEDAIQVLVSTWGSIKALDFRAWLATGIWPDQDGVCVAVILQPLDYSVNPPVKRPFDSVTITTPTSSRRIEIFTSEQNTEGLTVYIDFGHTGSLNAASRVLDRVNHIPELKPLISRVFASLNAVRNNRMMEFPPSDYFPPSSPVNAQELVTLEIA